MTKEIELTTKKVWGIIFIVLGIVSFLLGGYKYNQVNNFINMANTLKIPISSTMHTMLQNNIDAAYQESYILLGVGIGLAFIGTLMLKNKN